MNFDLCDHWVIYDPLRSEKTVITVDRIKTVLSCSHIDISFQEISEKSVEPVLMVVKGLICPCLVAWSPWFIFLLYTYDYLYFILFSFQISVVI